MNRIPDIYSPAKLRVITPCDGAKIGIGFDTVSGKTVRVKVSIDDALQIGHLARAHSLGSSGMPSIDVSSSSEVSS